MDNPRWNCADYTTLFLVTVRLLYYYDLYQRYRAVVYEYYLPNLASASMADYRYWTIFISAHCVGTNQSATKSLDLLSTVPIIYLFLGTRYLLGIFESSRQSLVPYTTYPWGRTGGSETNPNGRHQSQNKRINNRSNRMLKFCCFLHPKVYNWGCKEVYG